ncbi:MAG: cytochrome c1 [Alphaproteobacteria bacterium]|nr:cytochrome c1 [Alphaproteobacteria bacterium]
MRRVLAAIVAAIGLASAAAPAWAAGETPKPPAQRWSFDGLFGTFDRGSLQRGFQVYKEVCAACHALNQIYYRHLTQIGFTEDQVKQIAAEYEVTDGPNDQGEMFTRPARPSDRARRPFANEPAARAANNGAYPVDLSLVVKARFNGPDYLYALMTGYTDPPANVTLPDGMNYNTYFPGQQIAMAPPLQPDGVTYADGTRATVGQMARDVTMFLSWTSEPEMETRKRMGVKVILFLLVLTGMLYAVKRKVWAAVH